MHLLAAAAYLVLALLAETPLEQGIWAAGGLFVLIVSRREP